jgi:hypothetical protein
MTNGAYDGLFGDTASTAHYQQAGQKRWDRYRFWTKEKYFSPVVLFSVLVMPLVGCEIPP